MDLTEKKRLELTRDQAQRRSGRNFPEMVWPFVALYKFPIHRNSANVSDVFLKERDV